jgi:hypothetical protein
MPQIDPLTHRDGEAVRIFGIAICTLEHDDGRTSLVAVAEPEVLASLSASQQATIVRWCRAYQQLQTDLPATQPAAGARSVVIAIHRPDLTSDAPTLILSPRGAT